MMIRSLFVILLMIGLMMPCAWAEEKVDVPFEVPQNYQQILDHIQNRTDSRAHSELYLYGPAYYHYGSFFQRYLPIGSPLTKLHIETKDWYDGNTYYVQYTMTNPTDEMIEKNIDRINVFYRLWDTQKNSLDGRGQYSDGIRKLTIPPHSAQSFILPLIVKEPFDCLQYIRSEFHFTDRSTLSHGLEHESPLPDVLMAPIMLPSGEVYLAMKNHHPTKTISDIREIHVNYHFRKNSPSAADSKYEEFNYTDASPLPLTLKPQETAFYRLPQSIDRSTRVLPLAFVWLYATIDGTRHCFDLLGFSRNDRIDYNANYYAKNEVRYYTPTIFDKYGLNLVEASGTYETDGTTLYGYLRIKNPHNNTIPLSSFTLYSELAYYRADDTLSRYIYNTHLPAPLTIAPGEEKLFSFTLPLPQDVAHTLRFHDLHLKATHEDKTYRVHYDVEFKQKKLTPSEKALYTPVTNIELVEHL